MSAVELLYDHLIMLVAIRSTLVINVHCCLKFV